MTRTLVTLLLSTAITLALSATARAADAPSFTKDVQPFLKRYCVECHGERRPKAGVRYDSYQAMMEKSRKRSVVAGKPDESKLVMTMTGQGKMMPPRKFQLRPTAAEIDMIKAWIKTGARDDSKTGAAPAEEKKTSALDSSGSRVADRFRRPIIE